MQIIIKKIKTILSRKSFVKRILGFFVLFGLGAMLFFSTQNNVYAQGGTTLTAQEQFDEDISSTNNMLDSILKLIYALLWPVLFIAGLALDNTLVYGSFLHLDASLWTLWNIMKNFANFALGFLVLFAIVRNVFDIMGSAGDKWKPLNIIKKTLIAGVMIQMSWFLVAAVIDVSTILTYSIGGLPMTVLENNPQYNKMPVMGVNANLGITSTSDSKMALEYYHTYGDKKLGLCKLKKINGLSGAYIVGVDKIIVDDSVKPDDYMFFEKGYCALGAWPYKYKEYMTGTYKDNKEYKNKLNSYISALGSGESQVMLNNCNLIPVNSKNNIQACTDYGAIEKTSNFFTSESDGLTVDNLLEKSKGFVGPFITIYSSLLDFSSITSTNGADISGLELFFSTIIKVLFAVALFFPVLALAVVLISRIGILWLTIAISPILVLLNVFKDALGDHLDGSFKMFNTDNLVKLIFAPVFVVFAISMSLIFLTALTSNNHGGGDQQSFDLESLNFKKMADGKTYSINDGLMQVKMDLSVNTGLDSFAEFIVNLFAVGIIWFFLFFAVKMTGTVGESVGKKMDEGIRNLISKIPVVPIPGAGFVGVGAASGIAKKFQGKITGKFDDLSNERLQETMPWLYGEPSVGENDSLVNVNSEIRSTIVDRMGKQGATAESVWNSLTSTQQHSLSRQGIKNAAGLGASYNYFSNNVNNFMDSTGVEDKDTANIKTLSAQKYTADTIQSMITSKDNWKDWAAGAVGSNVTVSGGKTMVMVNKGTASNPEFKLISQDEYSTKYLGKKDDKYDKAASEKIISDKIKTQYAEEYGADKLTEDQKINMNKQIASQQKELEDRLIKIEKEKAESTTINLKSVKNEQDGIDESGQKQDDKSGTSTT